MVPSGMTESILGDVRARAMLQLFAPRSRTFGKSRLMSYSRREKLLLVDVSFFYFALFFLCLIRSRAYQ